MLIGFSDNCGVGSMVPLGNAEETDTYHGHMLGGTTDDFDMIFADNYDDVEGGDGVEHGVCVSRGSLTPSSFQQQFHPLPIIIDSLYNSSP
ncbi:hypothetical protein [Absidia glauca]|uniref:Uncharacterized protein n=1 Tax=Absidia glauca TaxID=4829 RepID=A0A168PHL9_ABSGL|nr:hypothetical protein [Absidia glauca]